MAHTLNHLRDLGYEVGIAFGGVAVEEKALAEARAFASVEQLELDVQTLVSRATQDAIAMGLPAEDVQAIAARVFAQSLRELKKARDEHVAFHERALEIARGMATTFRVEGPGISVHLSFTDDSGQIPHNENDVAALASLCDPALHAERLFQHDHHDAHNARETLARKGYVVVRPDPVVNVFDVKERGTGTVVAPKQNPPDLPPLAETLPDLTAV